MYFEPLTKTSVEILTFLSSRIRERFTVRQIANAIGKDYKITHVMTLRLAKQQYIIAEKKPPVTYCRLNLKGDSSLFAYVEGIRASRFFVKHRDLEIIANELRAKVASPFYIMILFGSHVKGIASEKSDLDVLFIIPDRKYEREIELAVGAVERLCPIGIHEVALASSEFAELLRQGTANVGWEAVDSRIVSYGSEVLFRMLEDIL
jgi:predicted nucleotidyltransferase